MCRTAHDITQQAEPHLVSRRVEMQCIDTAVMFNQLTSNLEPGSRTLMGTVCDFRMNCTVP
jgi:hypothetical protein